MSRYIDADVRVGVPIKGAVIIEKTELTDECIDKIAEAVVQKLADRKTENSSEKPNNCEHITEDGVTCAKYPACDDCLDNPLNKVKGSKRLVKGSEQTEPTISKMEQVDKDINVRSKTEPQTSKIIEAYSRGFKDGADAVKAMPQTDIGTSDTVYSDTAGYVPRVDMTDCSWK